MATATGASAAQAPIDLGSATSFAVLAGSTVTNTGPSVVSGDLGVSPGSAVTGFRPPPTEPGLVINGTIHAADAVADLAQTDETTGYTNAGGRKPVTNVPVELGGRTLVGGVYVSATLGLTGTLTLNGDASSVWIFRAGSTLTTATSSRIVLTGGASACNVFWQVGSSATLGSGSAFVGTVLAHTAITAKTRATVQGRLFAQTAAVTLDTNTITRPDCITTTGSGSSASTAPGSSAVPTTTTTPGGSGTPSSPVGGGPGSASGTSTGQGGGLVGGPRHGAAPSAASSSSDRDASVPARAGHRTGVRTGLRRDSTTAAVGQPAGPADTTTTLASTGSNLLTPVAIGLLALVGGSSLLLLGRRHPAHGRHRG